MTTGLPKTDRLASIASDEFQWDIDGHTESHRYLAVPVLKSLLGLRASTVLDLGSGNGALSAWLNGHNLKVTGLDHSRTGVELARQQHPDIRFDRHDFADPLPVELVGQFDAVVSVEVIEHLPLPRKLMQNARDALKPGGALILTTPFHGYWKNLALALTGKFDAHWHPLRDYGHIKFFSQATLTQLFSESGFTDIRCATAGRIPPLACSMIMTGRKYQ